MKPAFSEHCVDFPLLSLHRGLMFGSGGTGLFLWGKGRRLILSAGQGDLWDHRGGMQWGPEQNFADIRRALENNDPQEIGRIFAEKTLPGLSRPTLLPLGRIEITLPPGFSLEKAVLGFTSGLVTVTARRSRERCSFVFAVSSSGGRRFACSGLPRDFRIKAVPSYFLCSGMADRRIKKPECFTRGEVTGFLQSLPADESAALCVKKRKDGFEAVCLRSSQPWEKIISDPSLFSSFSSLERASRRWWRTYWKDIPEITLPDADLMRLYYLGLYKFGCMTDPAGPAPGLQGSWIEDCSLPPWQGDYHFNINFQMCLTPGLAAGKFDHLRSAFSLLLKWKDLMARNALYFAGTEQGYMIPHAVDDRCTCMGKFWTGCIDHGCAAWVGHLMFRWCLYAADMAFLKEEVMDFLKKVLNVFYAMMEKDETGTLSLPVSVSPEYNASGMNAWGRNSSFQLAAVHAVCLDLIEAARLLGELADPLAVEIENNLPQVTLIDAGKGREVALWEGQALEDCHRHHSHLAGITPFGTLDPQADFMEISDKTWTRKGMGEWAGWSYPWASQLRTRFGNAAGAVMLLKFWNMCYTSPAGTSLYMPPFRGITLTPDFSVMQMDAEMGCVTAVTDLFAYCDRDVMHFFKGVPRDRKEASFRNMHLPYGVTASGRMTSGRHYTVKLSAGMDAAFKVSLAGCAPVSLSLRKGESITLRETLPEERLED